jgi:hypothetical protein
MFGNGFYVLLDEVSPFSIEEKCERALFDRCLASTGREYGAHSYRFFGVSCLKKVSFTM